MQIYTHDIDEIKKEFIETRRLTLELFKPLDIEDAVMQSDDFGSPPNWHLAHTNWFYHKILEELGTNFKPNIKGIQYLNSYYQRFGYILPKPLRGRYPRPLVRDTLRYRRLVDKQILALLEKPLDADTKYKIMLANQHEMQHQELMIYDLQHYFNRFPDADDNYKPRVIKKAKKVKEKVEGMVEIEGGLYDLGFNGKGFCYDNELPEHKVYIYPYKIDKRLVTNGEFIKFIEDGGYKDPALWLDDGWHFIKENNIEAPLYWKNIDGKWMKKDLTDFREIDKDEPVVNVSYYEADAYARWAGKRLPTEAEWEKAASWDEENQKKRLYPWGDEEPTDEHANLLESFLWKPSKAGVYPKGKSYYGCYQMIGDVWEWTSSEYTLYPGFRSLFKEYNDKWAINQKVLRGGSFATPRRQIRNSYRNFFRAHDRIHFAGFRCAKDA
ncbi:MAG: ergothioneine biosynthesis protein EgtB [Candidatus Nitrosocaldaceae archaeon]|nr:MAG: ergothioneine biosynthesis protein EgtB [Candidatus Nitrosocaldaceae archaeon]